MTAQFALTMQGPETSGELPSRNHGRHSPVIQGRQHHRHSEVITNLDIDTWKETERNQGLAKCALADAFVKALLFKRGTRKAVADIQIC